MYLWRNKLFFCGFVKKASKLNLVFVLQDEETVHVYHGLGAAALGEFTEDSLDKELLIFLEMLRRLSAGREQ